MTTLRPLLAGLASGFVLLLLTVPSVAADLRIDTRSGTTYGISTHGSATLAAPQNTSIEAMWGGYLIDWSAPSSVSDQVVGYTIYRLPAPGTDGALQVFRTNSRATLFYDNPPTGDYVYLVTAVFGNAAESVPARPASTLDVASNYPHCSVVSIYTSPPWYDTNIECLFPLA